MSVTVAGDGTAVRSNGDVTLAFQTNGTKIGQKNSGTNPIVYLPITNPASTTAKLQTVLVDFDGGSISGKKGMVDEVEVYYGQQSIYDSDSNLQQVTTFHKDV